MSETAPLTGSASISACNKKNSSLLEFRDVGFEAQTVRGEPFTIIDDLSFTVHAGEFVCIVGPSGCGKTTTLTLAAGFAAPTRGTIHRGVEDPVMVFQSDTVFEWMSVEANVMFPMALTKVPKQERLKARDRILHLVGLSRFRKFFPRELSGGMRKRLELGRAWATDSPLLLLDEPLGNLDYFTRSEMQLSLQEIWLRERRAIVMITHDPEEAAMLGSRVLCMQGPPARIHREIEVPFDRPRDNGLRFTPEFAGIRERICNS